MRILDPTASVRSIWFEKDRPEVIYGDLRVEKIIMEYPATKERKYERKRIFEILPDVQMDYTSMPFPDGTFDMVVWDPPHLYKIGTSSILAARYGKLPGFDTWKDNIRGGFDECWRVLKINGTLIFKWAVRDISLKEVLDLAPPPLFGHKTGSNSQTRWITFVKFE